MGPRRRADTLTPSTRRVTTRKIRSLLRDYQESFGLPEDTWILDELRELAGILGVARDAEVLAERYENELNRLATDLVADPCANASSRMPLRYRAGLRRSLIAMRSQRYFRVLDALDALVAQEPAAVAGGEAGAGDHRLRLQQGPQGRQGRQGRPGGPGAEHGRNEALHRIRKRASGFAIPRLPLGRQRCPSRRRSSRRCSAITRTAWSAGSICFTRRRPPTAPGRTRSPTACCTSRRPTWRSVAVRNSTTRCANWPNSCAKPADDAAPVDGQRRASWPVSRILLFGRLYRLGVMAVNGAGQNVGCVG